MERTTIVQAGATGVRVLMKGTVVSVFVLVAALKTSASTSACGSKSCLPASDYDQSCTQDSDCVGIAEGQLCEEGCIGCANAAINVRDQARYQSAVSGFSGTCSCPGVPIGCNAGTCGIITFPAPAREAGSQDAAVDASAGADAACPVNVPCGCACPTVDGDGGVCVCASSSMPACAAAVQTMVGLRCESSGSCMNCLGGAAGIICDCTDAGPAQTDAGGLHWACIPTEQGCSGGTFHG